MREKETCTPDLRNLQSKGCEQTLRNEWLNEALKLAVITEGEHGKATVYNQIDKIPKHKSEQSLSVQGRV